MFGAPVRISTACCGSIVEGPLAQSRWRRVTAARLSWGGVVTVSGSLLRGGRATNTDMYGINMARRSSGREEDRKVSQADG